MYIIKKINIADLARLLAIICFIAGFIPAVLSLIPIIFSGFFGGYGYFRLYSLIPLIVIPLGAGVAGFIYGAIIGFIYNQIAGRGYGLKIDLEKTE